MSNHVLGQNRMVPNTQRQRLALMIGFAALAIVLLLCLLILKPAVAGEPARLQFTRIGPTRIGLFLASADGHNERALLPADGLDYTPSFSLDGSLSAGFLRMIEMESRDPAYMRAQKTSSIKSRVSFKYVLVDAIREGEAVGRSVRPG